MAKTKKKGNPLLFGLVLLGVSIGAIWKNEHRFDYYKAAEATKPAEAIEDLTPNRLFSHTGKMDQELTMAGHYVQSFQGYLEVFRSAEIYAWDRDEDDDGVTWSLDWMSYLQDNRRNEDLKKLLTSANLRPSTYHVSNLRIDTDNIQFVDERQEILPSSLQLSKKGTDQELAEQGEYFYLAKGGEDELGDERLSYRGLPVPATATYFGKWGEGIALAHQAEEKEGFITEIIDDKGILHHLVAGDRETALKSIKAHLARLKNIVRIIGIVVATIGGGVFFSSLTRFLIFIPMIGPLINRISGWLGMLMGFLLGIITMLLALLTNHPVVLFLFVLVLGVLFFALARNATRRRKGVQNHLTKSLGHSPSQSELEELEFVKLWQLMARDGKISASEQKRLDKWTKRHRWNTEKVDQLTQRAQKNLFKTTPRENLKSLILFSLADGRIDRAEMKSLEHAATKIGIPKPELSLLICQQQGG